MGARLRVYLADDHAVFITGISRVLESDPDFELVGCAGDGRSALSDLLKLKPEVAVLDLSMPGMTGLQVLSALRQAASPTRVLLLTGTEERESLYAALTLGAKGYLLKTAAWSEVASALKEIGAGGTILDQKSIASLAEQIEKQANESISLSLRECEVLGRLSKNQNINDIARDLKISSSTVKTYLHRIYEKLGVNTQAGAVAEALRRGMIE